jgi:hypothetical protein
MLVKSNLSDYKTHLGKGAFNDVSIGNCYFLQRFGCEKGYNGGFWCISAVSAVREADISGSIYNCSSIHKANCQLICSEKNEVAYFITI